MDTSLASLCSVNCIVTWIVGVVFSKSLIIRLWRTKTIACVVWGFLWGFLYNNSVICNKFLALEASFSEKKEPVGAPFPHYLAISFRSPSYMYIFSEASTLLVFHPTPQMVLCFSCPSPHLFSHSPILLPTWSFYSFPLPLYIHNYLFLHPKNIHPSPLFPYLDTWLLWLYGF